MGLEETAREGTLGGLAVLARDMCAPWTKSSHHPRPHTQTQKHLSQKMMRARVLAQGFTIAVLMAGKDTQTVGERGGMNENARLPT